MSPKNGKEFHGLQQSFTSLLLGLVFLAACSFPQGEQLYRTIETQTATGEPDTPTAAQPVTTFSTTTPTPTGTFTLSPSPSATLSPTNTITPTPSITSTATFAFPQVEVLTQAHCRYGPSSAYLHAADLYPGDRGSVRGRFAYSSWLYVKFDKLSYFCWVAPSVVDVSGDTSTVRLTEPNLQQVGSNIYGPPQNVRAVRDGNQVTLTWDIMQMTEDKDRGYFIEAWVCQDGGYLWWTVSFPNQYTTSYTVKDEAGCAAPSRGQIYTVEKHGYSEPAEIPWP